MTTTTTKNVNEKKVIKLARIIYKIESETTKGKFYTVIFKDDIPTSCDCKNFTYHEKNVCKHMHALMASLENGSVIDASNRKEKLTTIRSWKDDDYTF